MNESSLDFAEDTGDVNSGNLSGHLVVYRPPRLAHGPERNISQSVGLFMLVFRVDGWGLVRAR